VEIEQREEEEEIEMVPAAGAAATEIELETIGGPAGPATVGGTIATTVADRAAVAAAGVRHDIHYRSFLNLLACKEAKK